MFVIFVMMVGGFVVWVGGGDVVWMLGMVMLDVLGWVVMFDVVIYLDVMLVFVLVVLMFKICMVVI